MDSARLIRFLRDCYRADNREGARIAGSCAVHERVQRGGAARRREPLANLIGR